MSCRRGSKVSIIVNRKGIPIGAQVTTANRNELYACKQVLKEVPKGSELTADRAYDAIWFKEYLRDNGLRPNIARRSFSRQGQLKAGKQRKNNFPDIPGEPTINPLIYRGRWVIERTFAWKEKFKRLGIRYERRAYLYQALWHFGCAMIHLQKLTG